MSDSSSTKGSPSTDKGSMASIQATRKSYRDMSYRDKPATPNSPSGTSVTTMYDHLLSPASPSMEEEKDDRLRNDLLDEICNDMGIDDSMDLDFDDFPCGSANQSSQQQQGSAVSHHKANHQLSGYQSEASDARKASAAVPTTSYSSSDSLCAIAKLTQSISTDSSNKNAADSVKSNMAISSSDHSSASEDSPLSDQGKLNARVKAAEALKQDSPQASELQNKSAWSATAAQWHAGASSASHQSNRRPPTVDFNYQSDDYVMDDMTAPDTMINFSEMPQQPNYYQLPQSAQQQENISFSLNLYPSSSSSSCSRPPFQQQGHTTYDFTTGRCSPQQRLYQSGSQPHSGPFAQPQSSTSAVPTSQAQASHLPAHHQPSQPHPNNHEAAAAGGARFGSQSAIASNSGRSSPAYSTTSSFQNSQQGFMQRLVTDKSSAFRSHPLFPLLRDLIIADMNFHEPSFPHQLIRDLPSDFNKLLKNYLTRNPPKGNYPANESVESVVMDALKYAHHTLIEKIQQKKSLEIQHHTQHNPAAAQPPSARPSAAASSGSASAPQTPSSASTPGGFGSSVRHNAHPSQNTPYGAADGYSSPSAATPSTPSYEQPLSVDTSPLGGRPRLPAVPLHQPQPHSANVFNPSPYSQQATNNAYVRPQVPPMPAQPHNHAARSMYVQQPPQQQPGMMCAPPNYTVSPNNPPLPRHQQSVYDVGPGPVSSVYNNPYASPSIDPYGMSRMPHTHDRHLMYVNNINDGHLVKAMMEGNKDMEGMNPHFQGAMKGNQPNQNKASEGRKHASLPKEAVNIMLNWLREHQDKPYPNDDEKGMLIKQTGLSITQINYWFTNARRRLLPKWRGEDM